MQFTKSIFMYARGEEVFTIQDLLSELNIEYGFTRRKIEVSGYFGFETVHVVRDFQNYFGIPPTGAYDYQTYLIAEKKFGEMVTRNLKPSAPAKPLPAGMNNRKW